MIAQATASRFRCLAALLAAIALLLAGCRREPASATRGSTGTAGSRRGGTVVTGWTSEPGGVNEYIIPSSQPTSEVLFRMFLHLVEEQSDFDQHPPTFAPQLARSYDWSADHKVLTFHLRDDVVWSDGVPVTADDVRWSWQAQIHPDVVWDNADAKQWITDVEVVDPHTVRFHFSRVYFKQLLDANEGLILPKHVWEKLPFSQWRKSADWFKQHLVVDGPFTIASWEPGQQVVLQRNERYYEKGLPRLDRVVMRFIPNQATGVNQLLNGELDFVPQIAPGDVPRVKAAPQLQLIALLVQHLRGRGLEQREPPLPRSRGTARLDPRHRPADDRRHPARPLRPGGRLARRPDGLGPRRLHQALALRPGRGAAHPRRQGVEGHQRRRHPRQSGQALQLRADHQLRQPAPGRCHGDDPGPAQEDRRPGHAAPGGVQHPGHPDHRRHVRGGDDRLHHGHQPRHAEQLP